MKAIESQTDPLPVPGTLSAVFDQVWEQLTRGARDRRHGFHLPVLATIDESGRPETRTVVLRAADREGGIIQCHTDARSPKVEQVARQSRVSWCFYDKGMRIQVRAAGSAWIERPDSSLLAAQAWDRSSVGARKCYLGPAPPSEPTEVPSPNLPQEAISEELSERDVALGRANFAVLLTSLDTIEWLALRHSGHRRARFTMQDGPWNQTWLEP